MRFWEKKPFLIGVVHFAPLPGSPRYGGSMREVVDRAVHDAQAYTQGGVDALCLENFGDMPLWGNRVPSETIASMAVLAAEIQREVTLPFGINCLRNDADGALSVAAASGGTFIRVNVHTGSAATDQGILEGEAARTVRKREALGGEIQIFADVFVKHARPLGGMELEDAARDTAYRGLADGLILTGRATGKPADAEALHRVREAVPDRLLLVGSGLHPDNAKTMLAKADGAIVGTYCKREGKIENPVDPERVRALVASLH